MKRFIPAMKANIAKQLSSDFGLNQTDIASRLGLTQAAVSNYLSGNYGEDLKKLEKNSDVLRITNVIAAQISKEKFHPKKVSESICDFCIDYLKENPRCEFRELVKQAMQ